MPDHPSSIDLGARAQRVDLACIAFEMFEHMPTDEAGGACDQQPAHVRKSGYSRSRPETINGERGQAMAKAGSSQRTPAAWPATYGTEI